MMSSDEQLCPTKFEVMRMANHKTLLGILGLACSLTVPAGELIYKPVNPAFGGNPLNGNWLLNSAQLQDNTSPPDEDTSTTTRTALDRFNSMIERLVLGQMASAIVNEFTTTEILDNGTEITLLEAGTYTIGDFQVVITDVNDIMTITTTDITTGETTEFVIDQSDTDF
jgi:curli production assembly/transport component CsgF